LEKNYFLKATEACFKACCGLCLGFLKGACGISFYTAQEVEEIESLKKLTESVVRKSSEFITEESVCEGIKEVSLKALSKFTNNLPNEAADVGIGAAATLICKKAFLPRFREILMDACVTITHCS
jgi:hypothetical protein